MSSSIPHYDASLKKLHSKSHLDTGERSSKQCSIGVEPGGFRLLEICSRSVSKEGWSYMVVCEICLPRRSYGDTQVDKARL